MTGLHWRDLPAATLATLREGAVIPAHPLALDARRAFDRAAPRALTRPKPPPPGRRGRS